ncbi:hypothetical protein ACFQ58_08640 [Agromyces sp. NPDC056523]|uniref:hypothetical protein n=1 Tax=Agromyces sp. NPDC056523 TaxID=3345850 RepID=UPI00366FCF45
MAEVAQMLGIGSPEAVRTWMRRHQLDAGSGPASRAKLLTSQAPAAGEHRAASAE